MSEPRAGQELEVQPQRLSDEGDGVAELPGILLQIAGVLPGEVARVRIEHVSPHRRGGVREAWAQLHEMITPSADRVAPPCPAYGECGGCRLQHLRYDEQVAWKGRKVAEAFSRARATAPTGANAPAVGAGIADPIIDPCVPWPRPLGYRNQAKYVYGRSDDGRGVLGAYAPRSHRLIDLAGCRLVEPVLDATADVVRTLLAAAGVEPYDERTRTGSLRYVILRASGEGAILATFVTSARAFAEGPTLAQELRRRVPAVVGVVHNVNPTTGNVLFGDEEHVLAGENRLTEQVGSVTLRLSSRAFFQLNREVAALAYERIRAALAQAGELGVIVDAYAGVGGIACSLAGEARAVIAIEENPAATAAGEEAAREAGLNHVRFVTADAAHGLGGLDRADAVVVNPPRAGVGAEACREVARLRPRVVAYLSCNPASLIRDAGVLAALGFALTRVTPFDMLPHTPHVEALAIFEAR